MRIDLIILRFVLKECTFSSPGEGPIREDAPSWCRAPFEPEGLLRFAFVFSFLLPAGTKVCIKMFKVHVFF